MSDQEVLPSPVASESLSNIELDPTADKGQTFLICHNEGFIISTLSSRLTSLQWDDVEKDKAELFLSRFG